MLETLLTNMTTWPYLDYDIIQIWPCCHIWIMTYSSIPIPFIHAAMGRGICSLSFIRLSACYHVTASHGLGLNWVWPELQIIIGGHLVVSDMIFFLNGAQVHFKNPALSVLQFIDHLKQADVSVCQETKLITNAYYYTTFLYPSLIHVYLRLVQTYACTFVPTRHVQGCLTCKKCGEKKSMILFYFYFFP